MLFEATNLVKHNHQQLAVVEATQAAAGPLSPYLVAVFSRDRDPNPH